MFFNSLACRLFFSIIFIRVFDLFHLIECLVLLNLISHPKYFPTNFLKKLDFFFSLNCAALKSLWVLKLEKDRSATVSSLSSSR